MTSPEETTCSDILCDKQRISDWAGQLGCGCYHMNHQRSNLALVHTIIIDNGQDLIMMLNFSSANFSKLYTNTCIPSSASIIDICMTEAYFTQLDSIRNFVESINKNGGFICVDWYKR